MSENLATDVALLLEQLRAERGLRPLTKEEEGTDIYHLPDGVFGFTYAPGLKEMPVFSKRHYGGFEIHRLLSGKVYVVGFVTTGEQAQINASQQAAQVVIYPDRWQQSSELTSVVDSRLHPAKKAVAREDGNPLRTLVYPG